MDAKQVDHYSSPYSQCSTYLYRSVSLARFCGPRYLHGDPQVALKAGIEAGEAFVLGDSKVASVCVAPLKGRDRAVEKAGNMPIGPDKDRTEGPAIAWVHRFDYDASEVHDSRSASRSGRCSQSTAACRSW